MKNLNDTERFHLKSILARAFINNKSVNYILKREHDMSLILRLMDYSINKAKKYGWVWVNDQNTACCIILDPLKAKKMTLYSIFLDIKLVFTVVGVNNVGKVFKKENLTNKYLPKNINFVHLWFIGVESTVQGQGLGSDFLKQIISYYIDKTDAICLETSTLINIPFYEKLGFEIYHVEDFGFDFYFLIKYLK